MKDKNIITINGANFYKSAWKGKTFEQFKAHEKETGLSDDEFKAAWVEINKEPVKADTEKGAADKKST